MTSLHTDVAAAEKPFLDLLDDPADVLDGSAAAGRPMLDERALALAACATVEFLLLAAFGLPWLRSALAGEHLAVAALGGAACASAALAAQGSYGMSVISAAWPPWRSIACAAIVGGLACLFILGAAGAHHALWAAALWTAIASALLVAVRAALAPIARRQFRRGLLLVRVAVLSTTPQADRVRAALLVRAGAGLALCGPGEVAHVLGQWHSLDGFCRDCRIDALVLDDDDAAGALEHAHGIPAQILSPAALDGVAARPLIPFLAPRLGQRLGGQRLGGQRLGGQKLGALGLVQAQGRIFTGPAQAAKTAFDLVVSGLILLTILPVLGLLALAVRLDSDGPVLFRQPRIGADDQTFHVLKFRTMYHDMADRLAARQTERGDPRVTRVGRLLRRLSLDELPQLLNVLRGEMSLVGPRPHAPHTSVEGCLLHYAVPGYALRHRVKPGITGWAQINGARGALSTRDQLETRLRLDLDYIASWSPTLDLRILAITLCREIFSRHAY